MQVVKSGGKKKLLPSNLVSMPTAITAGYFMVHAEKLFVLGKMFLTEAATIPRMRNRARPLAISLLVEGAAYLPKAAKGSLSHYQGNGRTAVTASRVGGERE